MESKQVFTRREVVVGMIGMESSHLLAENQAPYNAMGERVGEVTATTAIVHTRLTVFRERNTNGYQCTSTLHKAWLTEVPPPQGTPVFGLEGACPGAAGRVRLHYGKHAQLAGAKATAWVAVSAKTDFTHQFHIADLTPQTIYYYAIETGAAHGKATRRGAIGRFMTAPAADRRVEVTGLVITCQEYCCRDRADGFQAYESMRKSGAAFLACTGDNVYYDTEPPVARTPELARFHWQRMYSLPTVVDCLHEISGYWMKDDHDAFEDDCWPARKPDRVAPMTYQTLSPIFREQTPYGSGPYRNMRWGRGMELWFLEGRDFRSPNSDPDGPHKTLWGREQKEWLKRTLLQSDADFRVLVSPGCIIGPGGKEDRALFKMPEGGADSHGDGGYRWEGREFLQWLRDNKLRNVIVVGGDRHWQFHSVDPLSGTHEFGCGPVTDKHAKADPPTSKIQRFVRGAGGFLSIRYIPAKSGGQLSAVIRDVHGNSVHEQVMNV